MNTVIEIIVAKLPSESTVEVEEKIMQALDKFHLVVKKFTRFDENSELSNLNRRSGEWTKVSSELFHLVETMLKLSKDTNGAYDPTVIDFLETYGYDPGYHFGKLENKDLDKMVEKLSKERPSWKEIEMDKEKSSIKLVKGQRIDLGGIGKGYAIDLAYSALLPLSNYLINAGGDVRARGNNESDEPWNLELIHQDKTNTTTQLFSIPIQGKALACSGSWARKVKQFHHLIDPKTGKPENKTKTVYILSDKAIDADGLATAIFIGGKELLSTLSYSVDALIIDSDDNVHATGAWNKFLASSM